MNAETVKYIVENPKRLFSLLASRGLLNWLPDEQYLKIMFKMNLGYPLKLDAPKTYNEKIQWLKLNDRNPVYTKLVDKYAVRQYVADKVGEEYLVPLVGGPWKNADKIDFDALPESFVLKCSHDSGGIIVCKDKSTLDIEKAKKLLNKRLKINYYYANREWPYKNVEPCIIAEQYLENSHGELNDYKWYVFDGEPKFMLITEDRFNSSEETKFNYFDMDFNLLPFCQTGPNSEILPSKPDSFEAMKELAAVLAEGFPHLRVDLYDVNGKIYFGELTLYDSSGFSKFTPPEWDEILGSWLKLPV